MRKPIKSLVSGMTLALAILTGCRSEFPIPDHGISGAGDPESVIEVVGGTPAGLSKGSRGEPSKPGLCVADRLKMWIYRGKSSGAGVNPKVSQLTALTDVSPIEGLRFNGNNKVTAFSYTMQRDATVRTGYAVPALAYTETDRKFFEYEDRDGIENLGVKLTDPRTTPELFFGRLQMKSDEKGANDSVFLTTDGLMSVLRSHGSNILNQEKPEAQVFGRLYRIVSRLNVKICDVDVTKTESMELRVSNLPVALTLFGSHGNYYKVAAGDLSRHLTADDNNGEFVTIARTGNFREEKVMLKNEEGREIESRTFVAELGSFMFPSELGRRLRIRVNFIPGTLMDKDGNLLPDDRQYKEYDIRPTADYYVSGEDAEVYKEGIRKNDRGDVYIYDHLKDEFYSVANVMVNISGKYTNVFSETQEVEVHIEVCPSFEESHEFEFGDDGKPLTKD